MHVSYFKLHNCSRNRLLIFQLQVPKAAYLCPFSYLMNNIFLFFISLFIALLLICCDFDKRKEMKKDLDKKNANRRSNSRINLYELMTIDKMNRSDNSTFGSNKSDSSCRNITNLNNKKFNKTIDIKFKKENLKAEMEREKFETNAKNVKFITRFVLASFYILRLIYKMTKFTFKTIYICIEVLIKFINFSIKITKNSFSHSNLCSLIIFYLTILIFLFLLNLTSVLIAKDSNPQIQFKQIIQLHFQLLSIILNTIRTFLTFLIIFIVFFYPKNHEFNFEHSNYINHLKSISTSLLQNCIHYSSKLIGVSIIHLVKFENYVNYYLNY